VHTTDELGLLARIALRNVLAHRGKSIIVGSVFLLGTALVVVGNAVVDAMDSGMERSITESLAGHLQVYSKDAKDDLALYGDEFAGMPDFGVFHDFAKVAEVARATPNVRAIIPMGSQVAMISGGNELDRRLAELRAAVTNGDATRRAQLITHVRMLVESMIADIKQAVAVSAEDSDPLKASRIAAEATTDAFWARFDTAPLDALEFLENKVAPIQREGTYLGLWFYGTDLDAFREHFDRFEIVEGQDIPPGQRGFLFNHYVYEQQVKHRVARDLDWLKKKREEDGLTLADSEEMRLKRDAMVRQYRRATYQLGPGDAEAVEAALRTHLGAEAKPEDGLGDLMQRFLQVDDASFDARFALFYEVIAPRIELYAVPVGGPITVRTFTQSGYPRALNLPVYGTFRFRGLDRSSISGSHNLLDMVSFRELYGYMTPERRKEIQAIRDRVGVTDIRREDAEDALFGGDDPLEAEAVQVDIAGIEDRIRLATPTEQRDLTIRKEDVENGLAIHAAILLDAHDSASLQATKAELQKALDDAGLGLKVVTWEEAAGMVGQLTLVVRVILFAVVILLGVVALVVINNSMVMATMERVHEIGTMRAIGAQRKFVTRLFMAETLVLGLVSGGLGGVLGAALVSWLGSAGIPATNEFTVFLFSGARLRPELTTSHFVIAVVNVVVVGVLSTFYPARLASRIPPAQAMGAG
jgi:ABC-type lipoprotein release transport system permease subunit